MPLADGQVFGNYRVLSRLGAGGMGAVYLAEHPLIGRKVALKVIHKELAGNREIVSRFFNEARAVNTIGNEHIVEIHDLGQSPEGAYFFIMEYLDGRTLAQVLEREHALDVGRALHVAAQIATALGAAHQAGIIHRDLKPDNIMLVTRGRDPDFVKVLDFGLAKMFVDAGVQLTAQGVVLGTPQYMSPEACESKKDIGPRADVYSLGVLLFQMTTGQLPFDGATMGAVLVQQVTQLPPAPRGLAPDIPPAVEQIILRCLAKQPEARFASMEALRAALLDPERYLAGGPPIMPSAPVPVTDQERATTARDASRRAPAGQGAGQGAGHDQDHGPTLLDAPAPAAAGMPVVPENRTMHIATPQGYKPRKRWPVVVAVAAAAVVAAAVTLIVLMDSDPAPPAGSAAAQPAAAPPAPAAAEPPAAEAAEPPAAAPPAPEVRIQLATEPAGAQVLGADGEVLGVTPMTLSLPRGSGEHVLVFRHPRTRERRTTVDASEDRALDLELEVIDRRKPAARPAQTKPRRPTRKRTSGRKKKQRTDELLMRPDF